jgi:hypothetical protein
MEEYMRVMSDDDDEPSQKKSVFNFFKKKKKYDYDETEEDNSDNLYDSYSDDTDEDTAEEIPVVPFDNSQVQYEDEYSSSPEDGFITDDEIPQAPMNLYDYIEADFDYEAEENTDEAVALSVEIYEEVESEEITEETESEEIYEEVTEVIVSEEIAEEIAESSAETTEEDPTETEEVVYPEETEEFSYEDDEAIEEIIPQEEPQEVIYEEAPTAGMVFEDIFSVSDESKRSHTGGNWNEVFGEEAETVVYEPEAVIYPQEEAAEEVAEVIEELPAQVEDSAEEIIPTEETSPEADEEAQEEFAEDTQEEFIEEDEAEPVKSKLALKILMTLAIVICLAVAGVSIFASSVLGVNTGKLFSDRYRAFSVPETISELGINKGDLVITENIYASADELYVYTEQTDGSYKIGKVTATTTNLMGDYLYITQTSDDVKLINRDTSLGVVTDTYSGIGSVLSVICDYGIYIAIASIVFAIALIICLAIIISKQRRYEAAAAIYDNPDNFRDDDNTSDSDNDNNDEYYSDYDTDGIEQGLFAEL